MVILIAAIADGKAFKAAQKCLEKISLLGTASVYEKTSIKKVIPHKNVKVLFLKKNEIKTIRIIKPEVEF